MKIQKKVGILVIGFFLSYEALGNMYENRRVLLKIPPSMYNLQMNKIKTAGENTERRNIRLSRRENKKVFPGNRFLTKKTVQIDSNPSSLLYKTEQNSEPIYRLPRGNHPTMNKPQANPLRESYPKPLIHHIPSHHASTKKHTEPATLGTFSDSRSSTIHSKAECPPAHDKPECPPAPSRTKYPSPSRTQFPAIPSIIKHPAIPNITRNPVIPKKVKMPKNLKEIGSSVEKLVKNKISQMNNQFLNQELFE